MTRIGVRRNNDYEGPKSFNEVIKAIKADADKEKRQLSEEQITSVITAFFSKHGLPGYLRNKKRAFLKGFGTFILNIKRTRPRETRSIGKKAMRRKRDGVIPMNIYRKKIARIKNENHLRRIAQCREEMFKLREKNKYLESIGWKPWPFRQYCSVIHETELIVYEKLVKEIDAKKASDMKSGIYEQGDLVYYDAKLFMYYEKIDDSLCYICPVNRDNTPSMQFWGKSYMPKVQSSLLEPYIAENLFFI